MVTMWSVKTRPKPGSASNRARSPSGTGFGLSSRVNSMVIAPSLSASSITLPGAARSAHDFRRNGIADVRRRPPPGRRTLQQILGDGGLNGLGGFPISQMLQEHRHGEDRRRRIGETPAGDIGRAAVHRLEHARGRPLRIDISAGRKPDAARNRRTEIGENIAEQIVSDNDVETSWVGHEINRRRVNVTIIDADAGKFGGYLADRPGPQISGVHQHVVLVDDGEFPPRPARRTGERVADHPRDPKCGIHALFGGDFLRRPAPEETTRAGVGTLGALPHHEEIDLLRLDVGKRRAHTGKQLDRAEVDVVVEFEAQAQEQTAFQHTARHARVADRAEEDRVMGAQFVKHGVRQGLPGCMPPPRAKVVLGPLDLQRESGGDRVEHFQSFGHHLRPDAVAGDDRQPDRHDRTLAARHSSTRSTARPEEAPISRTTVSTTVSGMAESTVRAMSACPPFTSRATCMPAILMPCSPRIRPRIPTIPGRSSYRKKPRCSDNVRSTSKSSIFTSFSTCFVPASVPATDNCCPVGSVPRTVMRLRKSGLSSSVTSVASTPRSWANSGAFTYVTVFSTMSMKTPLSTASCSTLTSYCAISPRTSTSIRLARPPARAVKTRPSFSASGSPGRTSSAIGPPCTLTASGTNSPLSASRTDFATAVPAFSCASCVLAPRCGVTTTLGNSKSGLAVVGSVAKTSRPTPPTRPSLSAIASASSSTRPPRAALMMMTPGLTIANSRSPRIPTVSGVFGKWTVMMSLSRSNSSRVTNRTPYCAARAGGTY